MGLKITQVDAFTNQPFAGNPAAVCVQSEPLDESLMQAIALEMNLSETAFLWPLADGFSLRWFTPATEVDLCGHATLASAHTLWTEGHLPTDQTARFQTRSGLLTATLKNDWIELNFPAQPAAEYRVLPELIKALGGISVVYVGKNRNDYLLVEVRSETEVKALRPDFGLLKTLPVHGVIVTSQAEAGKDYDFVSRFFAPAYGINEDPVTGSAHCCLAPYWQAKLGKNEMLGYQVSSRGGLVKVRCDAGSKDRDRVCLSGQAVTVMKADLMC
ncbi:MAG: PhzF family phenazine biosynthesis protein [Thainema sp.]